MGFVFLQIYSNIKPVRENFFFSYTSILLLFDLFANTVALDLASLHLIGTGYNGEFNLNAIVEKHKEFCKTLAL